MAARGAWGRIGALAAAWLAGAALPAAAAPPGPAPGSADAERLEVGARLYRLYCLPCHAPGEQYPGTQALRIRLGDSVPAALAERSDLSADYVSYVLRHGINAMPYYRRVELADGDVAAIAAWLARRR